MRAFMTQNTKHATILGSTYAIPLDTLSASLAAEARAELTLPPKSGFGPPPPPVVAWFERDNHLHVPRYYGMERYGRPVVDLRSDGVELRATSFVATLTDLQTRAIDTVVKKHFSCRATQDSGAMVCIPCGMGKTVLAVYLVSQVLKRKACILVHKGVIRDQWKKAFENFCPGIRVGIIQGKQWDMEEFDVVIAMVLTLAKKDIHETALDDIGTVVCDECHHYAAPVMNLAMRKFRAVNIIGLTATKDRPDGLTPLLHWTMGKEAFRAERNGGESVKVSMAIFRNVVREIKNRDGKPLTSVMTTKLTLNHARNEFVASRVATMRRAGRVIIVLSDRIEQLKILHRMIVDLGIEAGQVGMFYSATPEAARHEELSREIVLCSYGMANEGLDKREADTCVMASPKARVTQCIGRVQRPCETKQEPLVLDVVDENNVFQTLRWSRQRLYSKEKYEVQVVEVKDGMDDSVWFS